MFTVTRIYLNKFPGMPFQENNGLVRKYSQYSVYCLTTSANPLFHHFTTMKQDLCL